MVYANKPDLWTNIEREIAAISVDLCLKIVKNWVQRLDFYKRARGGHASFIHKGIERTFTAIKNFIDDQIHFCLI